MKKIVKIPLPTSYTGNNTNRVIFVPARHSAGVKTKAALATVAFLLFIFIFIFISSMFGLAQPFSNLFEAQAPSPSISRAAPPERDTTPYNPANVGGSSNGFSPGRLSR